MHTRALALSLARALALALALSHTHATQDLPAFGAFVTGWTEVTKDVVAALAAAEGADDDMAASVPRYNACIYQNPAIDVCRELIEAIDTLQEVLAACIAYI